MSSILHPDLKYNSHSNTNSNEYILIAYFQLSLLPTLLFPYQFAQSRFSLSSHKIAHPKIYSGAHSRILSIIMIMMSEIVPLQNLQYSTAMEKKKQEQRMQVRTERPEECGKTAYKPVAKAMAIAPIPTIVKLKAQSKCFSRYFPRLCMVIKKWRNTAHSEDTMAMVSVTTNALKAAFFDKIALPSSSL